MHCMKQQRKRLNLTVKIGVEPLDDVVVPQHFQLPCDRQVFTLLQLRVDTGNDEFATGDGTLEVEPQCRARFCFVRV